MRGVHRNQSESAPSITDVQDVLTGHLGYFGIRVSQAAAINNRAVVQGGLVLAKSGSVSQREPLWAPAPVAEHLRLLSECDQDGLCFFRAAGCSLVYGL